MMEYLGEDKSEKTEMRYENNPSQLMKITKESDVR
jgi:hypothetical protein